MTSGVSVGMGGIGPNIRCSRQSGYPGHVVARWHGIELDVGPSRRFENATTIDDGSASREISRSKLPVLRMVALNDRGIGRGPKLKWGKSKVFEFVIAV